MWIKYFTYSDGKLIRLSNNKETGTLNSNGYLVTRFQGKNYYVHRIIWEMGYGSIPDSMVIDHINGDRTDNHFYNLRLCCFYENFRNRVGKENSSGYKGVTWDAQNNKWRAQIKDKYKNIYLGLFNTPEEAYSAYVCAADKYHKEFASYGKA